MAGKQYSLRGRGRSLAAKEAIRLLQDGDWHEREIILLAMIPLVPEARALSEYKIRRTTPFSNDTDRAAGIEVGRRSVANNLLWHLAERKGNLVRLRKRGPVCRVCGSPAEVREGVDFRLLGNREERRLFRSDIRYYCIPCSQAAISAYTGEETWDATTSSE